MIKRGRTPVEEAARLLSACVKHTCAAERIPLEAAVGRVCMQDIFAAVCQPPFSRSPLDGYAARSADIAQASSAKPAVLPVSLHLYAGSYDRRSRAGGRGLCGGAGTDGLRPKNGFHL